MNKIKSKISFLIQIFINYKISPNLGDFFFFKDIKGKWKSYHDLLQIIKIEKKEFISKKVILEKISNGFIIRR